jgi:protein arginine kinase
VISSRVRLARNLRKYEFPHRADINELVTVRHRVWQALHATGESPGGLSGVRLLSFEDFTGWERQSLIDRYISSREHITEEVGRGVAANSDASISVMVNEEDHIRLQGLLPGLQLDAAYSLVDRLDDVLENWFDARGGLAYNDEFGYLTACPTNAGTGLRASVMLHLPGLEITGRVERARKVMEDKGFALRGSFGEGSKIWGHLHQLSNQATLGLDEADVLLEVENAAREVVEMERKARRSLPTKFSIETRDQIGRAFGTLRYAHRINCREATDCLSLLRLGSEMNWVKGLTRQRWNELLVWIRPAYMQVLHGRSLSGGERDTLRADLLRPHIEKIRIDTSFLEGEAEPKKSKDDGPA